MIQIIWYLWSFVFLFHRRFIAQSRNEVLLEWFFFIGRFSAVFFFQFQQTGLALISRLPSWRFRLNCHSLRRRSKLNSKVREMVGCSLGICSVKRWFVRLGLRGVFSCFRLVGRRCKCIKVLFKAVGFFWTVFFFLALSLLLALVFLS